LFAVQQVPDDVQSEDVVVVSEEDVEQKQLTDGVDAVQQFDKHIAARQVVAVQSARHADAVTFSDLLSWRSTYHSTQGTSFRRRSSEPVWYSKKRCSDVTAAGERATHILFHGLVEPSGNDPTGERRTFTRRHQA